MRVAFLTSEDARRPIAWSGTPYYMARALAREFGDVAYLGPVFSLVDFASRVRGRISRALLGRRHPHDHGMALAREYGAIFGRRIPPGTDLLVAPAASTQTAFLETDVPILYTSDATFRLMHDYYPAYSNLDPGYARGADEIERRALERAALAIYPSEWAARSAREHYRFPAERIRVIPYGANLSRAPSREEVLSARKDDELRLLLLGTNWERKGGPLAFRTAARLREAGLPARLTVCGCVPPSSDRAEWMDVVPRLDKRDPAQEAALSRLLLAASFLFVPSRSECYGIVFCEASAHGTPSIATDTGGIAGAVRHGENGFLLPPDATPDDFARTIAGAFADRDGYRRLVAASRDAYEARLNWDAWARAVRVEAERLLGGAGPANRGGTQAAS
ncbi:MAG TPA: glycosyltransferase family 4 protein [Acidobacteriota bacterium]|nr:glycosyltransferase family 4 protein [Acidobacteriota bacterium]